MSVDLTAEVWEHAPAGITSAEFVVLLAIAEHAQPLDRPRWPARTWGGDLAAKARLGRGLPDVLRRLAARGLEVRVPVGLDKRGRPVFAHRGHATVYRLPDLKGAASAAPLTEKGAATAAERCGQGRRKVRSGPHPNQNNQNQPPRRDPEQRPAALDDDRDGQGKNPPRRHPPPPGVAAALRAAGVPDDDHAAYWAAALADPTTTSSPAARITASPQYVRQIGETVNAERAALLAALPRCPDHTGQRVGVCSGCAGDHKVGDHAAQAVNSCHLCFPDLAPLREEDAA